MEAKPIHRLPHLSRKSASKIAAGSSVIAASENDVNTSGSSNFMFQTCPSNTQMIKSLRTTPIVKSIILMSRDREKSDSFNVLRYLPINNKHDSDTSQSRHLEEVHHGVLIVRLVCLHHRLAALLKLVEYFLLYFLAVYLCKLL